MKKGINKYNYALSLFTLVLMEGLYFLWQPYPKSIIKTIGSPWAYSDIITGMIYFLIFDVVIDISVRSMARQRELSSFFEWKNMKYIAALIAIQLCLDLVNLSGAKLLNEYAAIVYNVVTAAGWVLFALLFSCMTERAKSSEKRERIAVGIAAAALLLCVLLDIGDIVQRRALIEKYDLTSRILESRLLNIQFRSELRNMLLDFCCGAAFLTVFLLAADEKKKRYDEGWRLFCRMVVLSAACVGVYFTKAFLLPNNVIFPGYLEHTGYYSAYQRLEPEYDFRDVNVLTVYRFHRETEKKVVYCVSDDIICYNGNDLFHFKTDGKFSGTNRYLADKIEYDGFELIQICNTDAAIYASKEIVWMIGNEARHIAFKDIASAKENPILTALCIERITAGDWRFFEYGYEYLLKFEPEFIKPYMERYAAGEFTDSEVKYNSEYRPAYIQKIAMKALERARAE